MNTETASLSLSVIMLVNAVCEQYELDRRGGQAPRIEDAIRGWTEPGRCALLAELIALDLELRAADGETPDRREYAARFAGDPPAVAHGFELFERSARESEEPRDPASTEVECTESRAPSAAASLGSFGAYELLGEIARGGMGVVYKARQKRPNREVALKMILSGEFASEVETRRFRLEAELAANLEHSNIVPIYEVGEYEGRAYFSMKLMDGCLRDEIPRLNADPGAAARLISTIARAVHYAHERGFVHCDLKPSNILLDARGQPHVTDFGVARRVEEASSLTASGALMGTASYMAPEQASGDRKNLAPTVDVYGLGAVFYELLTGRPPFRAATVPETVVQVLEGEPTPPRELNPVVPTALESICLRCLEKSPADRFESAAVLAETLDRYLRGEDVPGTSLTTRLRRWTRREPELVARLGGLSIVALLTHYNYWIGPTYDPRLHYTVMAVLGVWALASAGYEHLLRRDRRPEATRWVWAATDMTALTTILYLLKGFDSDLIVGYPLLIASSGLWFRERLVWVTTAMAVAGYGVLASVSRIDASAPRTQHYVNIVLASLLLTGFIVARQARRFRALSAYYESRPRRGGS